MLFRGSAIAVVGSRRLQRGCVLQDMSLKCNEEEKSLSTETFAKVSLTNLRRQAVPDLASDLGMNIFKKVGRPHADVAGWRSKSNLGKF